MKEKDNRYKRIVNKTMEICIISLLVMVIEYYYFGLNNWNFRIPVTYDGGDAFSGIANMKMRMFGDGYRMGWPYHEDMSMYSPIFNMLSRIGTFIVGAFINDFFLAQNVFLFLIPTLNVVVCYLVFCSFNIRKWIALFSAFIYGFCPYVQIRLYLHQDLAAVECIPLLFMICFWLYEDEKFAKPCKDYFLNKKNVILIFLSWIISNNGIVYYPFFGCFIILITGVLLCIQKKSIKNIIAPVITITNIVFWLFIGFIPAIYGAFVGHGDVATNGTTRDAYRATVYGLDIRSMMLSPKGFGIKSLLTKYDYLLEYNNEQYYSYLGIVGIIGFLVLLFFLLINSKNNQILNNRIVLLSRINIMLVLLGTSCGFGVIIALFIPVIASYNRVSIFIVFASILTVTFGADYLIGKSKIQTKKYIFTLCLLFLLYATAFLEQRKSYDYFYTGLLEENTIQLSQDRVFFSDIENMAGTDSMIFVLPYMSAFENLQEGSIYDYDHYRGYMHTDTLRWSYGAMNGSKNDVWYKSTSELEPEKMIEELREKGFAGIYINVDGYEDDYGKALTTQLLKEIGTNQYILHESGHKVFVPIN